MHLAILTWLFLKTSLNYILLQSLYLCLLFFFFLKCLFLCFSCYLLSLKGRFLIILCQYNKCIFPTNVFSPMLSLLSFLDCVYLFTYLIWIYQQNVNSTKNHGRLPGTWLRAWSACFEPWVWSLALHDPLSTFGWHLWTPLSVTPSKKAPSEFHPCSCTWSHPLN